MVDNELPKKEEKEEKQKREQRKNLCKSRLLRYVIDLDFTMVVEKEKWKNYITDTQSHYVAREGLRQILFPKNLHQYLFQS